MTKAQELAVLDKAIAELGQASYLGPWLASVRHDVERSIRGDIGPALLPSEATVAAHEIIGAARVDAVTIVERARKDAARELDAARVQRANVLQGAARALRLAYESLEGSR
jgi:cell division septum initiation protein DivIVA